MNSTASPQPLRAAPPFTPAWILLLAGCSLPVPSDFWDVSAEHGPREPGGQGGSSAVIAPPKVAHTGPNVAALGRTGSCDDLLAEIQAIKLEEVLETAARLRRAPGQFEGEPGVLVAGSVAVDAMAGSAEDSGLPFSRTTVQVRDVDEPDTVKAEGDYLYALRSVYDLSYEGLPGATSLQRVKAWPARDLAPATPIAIEGYPRGMFVHEGRALVYSDVYSYDLPMPKDELLAARWHRGFGMTKLTVVDLRSDAPETLREVYVEGSYVSARRHGSLVRTVIQDGFQIPNLGDAYVEYYTPFGEPYRQVDIDAQVDAWLTRTSWAVSSSQIDDWLPLQLTRVAGELTPVPLDCSEYYVPGSPDYDEGMTRVLELDLADPEQPLTGPTVVGRADHVYANSDVLVLARSRYEDDEGEGRGHLETDLHEFALDDAGTEYVASGTVPGGLQSQFSLDEHQGVVRIATTDLTWSGATQATDNRVFTLFANDGWLDIWGKSEAFGDDERIFGTRFLEDRGYVVTFRQTDPLFVLDLSDPGKPTIRGELMIPGFSNFLFPLAGHRLFAMGRDATPEGQALGVALQIFDVSDSSEPALLHKYVYDSATYSEATFEHHAMAFHPDTMLVAFPVSNYGDGRSVLEVMDIDPEAGFTRKGALQPLVPAMTIEQCVALVYGPTAWDDWMRDEIASYPEQATWIRRNCNDALVGPMERGVFRGDWVFGVTRRGVSAQTVENLSDGVAAQITFPAVATGAVAGVAGSGGMGTVGDAATDSEGAGRQDADAF